MDRRLYHPYRDLVNSDAIGKPLETVGGMFRRFGFNDDNSFKLLHQFAEQRAFPDFSIPLPQFDSLVVAHMGYFDLPILVWL